MDIYNSVSLWLFIGLGLSTWVLMHFWLPDPPPDIFRRYIAIVVAGVVGAVIGGFLVQGGRVASNPMPGIIAAATSGLFLSGAVGFLSGASRKTLQ